ncbi:hypothetical protein MOOTH_00040 [Moorella thermoacetica]|nr:hypothetical protein MOOTH_00040 [Moorella thermoacetica]
MAARELLGMYTALSHCGRLQPDIMHAGKHIVLYKLTNTLKKRKPAADVHLYPDPVPLKAHENDVLSGIL